MNKNHRMRDCIHAFICGIFGGLVGAVLVALLKLAFG